MAWGWRVLSSGAPFTDGRNESEKGNDKVVIVLTDGANTYTRLARRHDAAGNKSTYAAYGYAGQWTTPDYTTSRIFQGTSVDNTDYSNANYTKAMDAAIRHALQQRQDGRPHGHHRVARSQDHQCRREKGDRRAEGMRVDIALHQGRQRQAT